MSAIDIRTAEVFVHDDVAYSIGDHDARRRTDGRSQQLLRALGTRRGRDVEIDRLVVGAVDARRE